MISQNRPILVPFFMAPDDPMMFQKSKQLLCISLFPPPSYLGQERLITGQAHCEIRARPVHQLTMSFS